MRRRAGPLVAALALATLAGCGRQPTEPAPPPTHPLPSPTYTCTPVGGEPYACTGQQYTDQEKQKVLTDSARRVFTRYFNESARLYRKGGAAEATADLMATTSGTYRAAKQAEFARLKRSGVKATGGNIELVRAEPDREARDKGFEVGLATCIDATTVRLKRGDKVVGAAGFAVAGNVYFKREAGALKIVDAEERPVPNC